MALVTIWQREHVSHKLAVSSFLGPILDQLPRNLSAGSLEKSLWERKAGDEARTRDIFLGKENSTLVDRLTDLIYGYSTKMTLPRSYFFDSWKLEILVS